MGSRWGLALIALLSMSGVTSGQTEMPSVETAACTIHSTEALADALICASAGEPCCQPYKTWFGAQYLLWWPKNAPTPGRGFGEFPSNFSYGAASGIRIAGGLASQEQPFGLEGSFFILERRADEFGGFVPPQGLVTPFLFLPAATAATVTGWNRFWGGDALINKAWVDTVTNGARWKVDWLAGFASVSVDESAVRTAVTPGLASLARIETRIRFYGGEMGARTEWQAGRWCLSFAGKCGLGDEHQTLRINSATITTTSANRALLQPSADVFAVMPQASVSVGYDLSQHIHVFVGYDFIDLTNVLRPGDEVFDVLPGARLQRNDFWAHGLNFGAAIRY
jgi:hypothetical protein